MERDQMLAYVSSEVESVKSMFAQREESLRRERDDALKSLAERDDADDEIKAEGEGGEGRAPGGESRGCRGGVKGGGAGRQHRRARAGRDGEGATRRGGDARAAAGGGAAQAAVAASEVQELMALIWTWNWPTRLNRGDGPSGDDVVGTIVLFTRMMSS